MLTSFWILLPLQRDQNAKADSVGHTSLCEQSDETPVTHQHNRDLV